MLKAWASREIQGHAPLEKFEKLDRLRLHFAFSESNHELEKAEIDVTLANRRTRNTGIFPRRVYSRLDYRSVSISDGCTYQEKLHCRGTCKNYPIALTLPSCQVSRCLRSRVEFSSQSKSCGHVLVKTRTLLISRRRFADDSKEMYQNVKRTCRVLFLLSKPVVVWRSRCRRRRVCVSSLTNGSRRLIEGGGGGSACSPMRPSPHPCGPVESVVYCEFTHQYGGID